MHAYRLIAKVMVKSPILAMIAAKAYALSTNSSTQSPSAIEFAARQQTRLFIMYVLVLIVAAALTTGFTILVWRAGNRYQEAVLADSRVSIERVKADAQKEAARIEADAKKEISLVKADSDAKIAAADRRSEEISAKANRDAEKLHEQNLATEGELEKERAKRVALEESISPRWLKSNAPNTIDVGNLKDFAGMKVEFDVVMDREANQAAEQIAGVLSQCGWKIGSFTTVFDMPRHPFSGVIVTPYRPDVVHMKTPEERFAALQEASRFRDAADSITYFLRGQGWLVESAPVDVVTPGTIKISVDMKPNPYFLPPELKAILKRLTEEREEERKRDAEFKKRLQRKNE